MISEKKHWMSTWKTDYKLNPYKGQKYIERKTNDLIRFFCSNCGSTRIFSSGLDVFCETCKAIFVCIRIGRNPFKKINPFLDPRLTVFPNSKLNLLKFSQIKFCYFCGNTSLLKKGIAIKCRNCQCYSWGYITSEKFDGIFRNEYLKESEQ